MTTHKEALNLALEALESSNKLINGTGTKFGLEGAMDGYYSGCFDVEGNNKLLNKAITAIKEALAQPEHSAPHGEPVAQDRDLHSHMMVVASRAVDAVTNNGRTYAPIKTYTRAICKAIQADKNLLAKLAPQPKEPEQEPVANVVLREGSPTLLREKDIKPTDKRLYTTPPQRKPLTLVPQP